MKIEIHKADSRGKAKLAWLKSYHTFSFADYYDPKRMGFGVLRVINDDIISPSTGFDTHPHNNMEIITIPIKGSLKHKDNMGNSYVIRDGEIQIMSAGTGITHSEYNNSDSEDVNLLQIWVLPKKRGIKPSYSQKLFNTSDRKNKFQMVVSPEKSENTVWINQDAYFSLADMDKDISANYKIKKTGNGIYIFIIEGSAVVGGKGVSNRDGAAITDTMELDITAKEDSKILLMEVPMR